MTDSFDKNGYICVPVIDTTKVSNLREEFLNTCKRFPEYQNTSNIKKYVTGGFSAFGNPSSFHNLFVRKIRNQMYNVAINTFNNKLLNIEMFFDRMMMRPKGVQPTKELWHRDITPNILKTDIIIGGWLNLDSESQYFSCIPGTHNEKYNNTQGFAKIPESRFKEFKNTKKKIEILPGHAIFFHQNIIHEVLPTKNNIDNYRVFHGFRLTKSKIPIFNVESVIESQSVPRIPSNQIPAMYYSANWMYTAQREALEKWSLHFKDIVCENKLLQTKGTHIRVVHQHMKSLKEYNLPLYKEYTTEEKQMFKPNPMVKSKSSVKL